MNRILMSFCTIMCYVLFKLIPTSCNSYNILAIIKIRRVKYGFMRVTSQILNAELDHSEIGIVGTTVWFPRSQSV